MRVLHLFDWYLPSTLSWVNRLLVHLSPTEIWVAAPWIVKNQFFHPQLRHFIFPLQHQFFPAITSEFQHPLWQRLFARSQRFFPSYLPWLERQLRFDAPDILHAHFGPTGCLYLPLAKKINRPLVVTFYGFDYQKLLHQRPVFREKYRTLFASAERVIAASPSGCDALEAMGCPANKLAIVRPSPDLALFPFVQRHKLAGQLRLVQASTFTEKKGHLTTLEAFRRALEYCPHLTLTLAGEQYDRAVVRAVSTYLKAFNLDAQVKWIPSVPHSRMADFLAQYDMFIHPSCRTSDGDHEASPVVLLEAQATGMPVLATRHFDLPDLVEHGQTGWLVAERDSDALAKAIRFGYEMGADQYALHSQAARARIEDQFTVEKSAAQLQKIYGELI